MWLPGKAFQLVPGLSRPCVLGKPDTGNFNSSLPRVMQGDNLAGDGIVLCTHALWTHEARVVRMELVGCQ